VPAVWAESSDGNLIGGLWALWDGVSTTGAAQDHLMDFVCWCYFSVGGASVDAAMAACETARKFFGAVGMMDIVLSYMDSAAMATMMASSNRADLWEIKVTDTRVALLPLEPTIASSDSLLVDCNVIDDEGGAPEGAAYSYHWVCRGRAGALINPIAPDTPTLDFTSSSDQITYIANRGVAAMDSVTCEVSVRLGGNLERVGMGRMGIDVIQRTVVVTPDSARVCPGQSWLFEVAFDPPFNGSPSLEMEWTASGDGGELLDQFGDPAPFTTTASWVDFHADSDGGHSVISVTASKVGAGGGRILIGTASADIVVAETPMFYGTTYAESSYDDENNTGSWSVGIAFTRVPGVGRYHVHGHDFYDWAYYGSSFSCTGPPWPSHSSDNGSEVRIFLTGGGGDCTPEGLADSLEWGQSRFAGAIWEITPICPD
jgi:hypothetical protein